MSRVAALQLSLRESVGAFPRIDVSGCRRPCRSIRSLGFGVSHKHEGGCRQESLEGPTPHPTSSEGDNGHRGCGLARCSLLRARGTSAPFRFTVHTHTESGDRRRARERRQPSPQAQRTRQASRSSENRFFDNCRFSCSRQIPYTYTTRIVPRHTTGSTARVSRGRCRNRHHTIPHPLGRSHQGSHHPVHILARRVAQSSQSCGAHRSLTCHLVSSRPRTSSPCVFTSRIIVQSAQISARATPPVGSLACT